MEVGPQDAFNARLQAMLEKHGGAFVDARDAVPNEYWGWEQDTPDRSHFREPGHAALAAKFVGSEEAQPAWSALERP